ncbi:hypothetical protein DTO271G3_6057 [Paecilomyces variotii]|nr:hypothetical protein DTO271G3_6057 [Paecilomyces variotii]
MDDNPDDSIVAAAMGFSSFSSKPQKNNTSELATYNASPDTKKRTIEDMSPVSRSTTGGDAEGPFDHIYFFIEPVFDIGAGSRPDVYYLSFSPALLALHRRILTTWGNPTMSPRARRYSDSSYFPIFRVNEDCDTMAEILDGNHLTMPEELDISDMKKEPQANEETPIGTQSHSEVPADEHTGKKAKKTKRSKFEGEAGIEGPSADGNYNDNEKGDSYAAPNGTVLSPGELRRLAAGVKKENGDTVFFRPSFIEDPWAGLKPVRIQ